TAAAARLGLAQPTVWNQVHALERRLGVVLVEPYPRGCRPTAAGRTLAELAIPLVAGFASLEEAFRADRTEVQPRLVVASSPRITVEDLPECVAEYERRCPRVRLTIVEMHNDA